MWPHLKNWSFSSLWPILKTTERAEDAREVIEVPDSGQEPTGRICGPQSVARVVDDRPPACGAQADH
jgi:hypothetical protein